MNLSVIIPYRKDSEEREVLFNAVNRRWRYMFPECEVIVADSGHTPFNRGASRNKGVQQATCDVVAVADADTVCNVEFLLLAYEQVLTHGGWSFPYRVYYNLSQTATQAVLHVLERHPTVEIGRPEVSDCEFVIPSLGGIYFVRREDFLNIQGYDEHFTGWSFEDDAWAAIADTLIARHDTIPRSWVAHLWHYTSEENRFGQPFIHQNRARAKQYELARGDTDAVRRIKGLSNAR